MTNPNDAVGTNAGFNGRTTPNAFNDVLATLSQGILSGWACSPKSGMTVQLGGDGTHRDVAIAEDNAGNRTTINNRLGTPVEITLGGAPSTGNRIDSIVAYVENPQSGAGSSDVDFPSQVGIIAVQGTAAGTPTAPNEATIRTAITADGATGASAYYVVLANITVGQGVTTIGSGSIAAGTSATLQAPFTIADGSITTNKVANSAITAAKLDWSTFGAQSAIGSTTTAVGTSATTMLTISLGAGTWALFGVSDFNHANTDIGDCYLGFDNASTNAAIGNRFYFNEIADGTYWKTYSAAAVVTLTGTTSVKLVSKKGQGTLSFNRCQIIAIRIA